MYIYINFVDPSILFYPGYSTFSITVFTCCIVKNTIFFVCSKSYLLIFVDSDVKLLHKKILTMNP